MKSLVGLFAGLFLVSGIASAATIQEGVDYTDLANPFVGDLGVGVTTISGTASGTCGDGGVAPFPCIFGADPGDTFNFGIGAGLLLTSLDIDLTDLAGPTDMTLSLGTKIGAAPETTFDGLSPGVYMPTLPGGGTGEDVRISLGGFSAPERGDFTLSWTVTATVTGDPVPVSGTAVLLLGAIAACGAVSLAVRRKG